MVQADIKKTSSFIFAGEIKGLDCDRSFQVSQLLHEWIMKMVIQIVMVLCLHCSLF